MIIVYPPPHAPTHPHPRLDINLLTPSSSFHSDDDVVSSTTEDEQYENQQQQKRKSKNAVTFSPTITFHHHKIIIGDSPSCPILPLMLDWQHAAEPQIVDFNKYESNPAKIRRRRNARRCSGGSLGAKKLMYFERSEILQDVSGYTSAELYKAKQEAMALAAQRKAQIQAQERDNEEEEEEKRNA